MKFLGLQLGFPMGRDSATFWDKGKEIPSLYRDKRTTRQAHYHAPGEDWPGQPVDSQKIFLKKKKIFDPLF